MNCVYRLLVTRTDGCRTVTTMEVFPYGPKGDYSTKKKALVAALVAAAGQFDSAQSLVLSKAVCHCTPKGVKVKYVANRTIGV